MKTESPLEISEISYLSDSRASADDLDIDQLLVQLVSSFG